MTVRSKSFRVGVVISTVAITATVFSAIRPFTAPEKTKMRSISFGASVKPDIPSVTGSSGFRNVFADVAEKVLPTVVSVIITKIGVR